MVIFAVAALAGFLLFGWTNASPRPRDFFLKPRVQGVLGVLVLGVALVALMFPFVVQIIKSMFPFVDQIFEWMFSDDTIKPIQWPEYWVALIVQRLTGTEAMRFILGAAFGCILRHWGPHFWEMRLKPETRYNWVAISLAGLLLLAAAIPYIERQLGGMTALKTPVAEFQFEGMTRAESPGFKEQRKIYVLKLIPNFATISSSIKNDLSYLELLEKEAKTITDPSGKKKMLLKKIGERREIYDKTQSFINDILTPLGQCAKHTKNNYLDIESIRHALSPVAQKLRLLIQSGQSQNSTPAIGQLENEVEKSLELLKKAVREKGQCKWDKSEIPSDSKFLTDAPHIYLALALLDGFNENREGAISILKKASEQFGDDHDLSPGILFNINFHLSRFLYNSQHDPESIFRYLDRSLKIAQDTSSRIDKWKQFTIPPDQQHTLLKVKKRFKKTERWAKNALAYLSAQVGVRKFEALLYAKDNYDNGEKLSQSMKLQIIDTYGYVKMAFAARKVPPDFEEIQQAKALFKDALSHAENLPDSESKRTTKRTFQSHLQQADRLMVNQ